MEVVAILSAIGGIFQPISDLIVSNRMRKAAMTPQWMQPSQFQRRDRTYDFIIGGILLVIIGTLIAVTVISTKK